MENTNLYVTPSPHIRDNSSTRGIMLNVAFALLPTLVASSLIFGLRALILTGVTVAACVGFEALYNIVMKRPQSVSDFSAIVTGLILSFNFPSTLPFYIAIIGAFTAIVVTKMLFGGIGFNFANPALVGRMAVFLGFTGYATAYAYPSSASAEILASATPLVAGNSVSGSEIFLDLLLGTHGGMIGETCALTLILGGAYLIFTKTISPAIPLSILGTVAVLSLVLGQDVILQLFSGGLIFMAFFMATDYTTSPFTTFGKIIFGVGIGVILCLIRFYGTYPEGASFALLLMNLVVPFINNLTRQKPLGGAKR